VLARRADAALKHQVELDRLAYFVIGVGVLDGMPPAELAKLGAGVVIELVQMGEIRNQKSQRARSGSKMQG
jgi:hypothetical protein